MKVTKCGECGFEISMKTGTCPGCGESLGAGTGGVMRVFRRLIFLIAAAYIALEALMIFS